MPRPSLPDVSLHPSVGCGALALQQARTSSEAPRRARRPRPAAVRHAGWAVARPEGARPRACGGAVDATARHTNHRSTATRVRWGEGGVATNSVKMQHGHARAVERPCRGGTSATLSRAQHAVGGLPCGACRVGVGRWRCGSARAPVPTHDGIGQGVPRGCLVPVAGRVGGGRASRLRRAQGQGARAGGARGHAGAEQCTGADRAKGSLCCKPIFHGAAAHRGR
jgi:hypothetical protein